jgi:hypothetical protein
MTSDQELTESINRMVAERGIWETIESVGASLSGLLSLMVAPYPKEARQLISLVIKPLDKDDLHG